MTVADDSVPRVLVVDDEEPVMLTIQGILELDGYVVAATSSGEHALELLGEQHFDVLLTDLRLDGMAGIDLLREARRQSPDTVSIMLTGYASLDTAVAALREGAYGYLFKPCDVVELRRTVLHAVERSRVAAELRNRMRDLEQANETIRHLNLELESRVEQATAELRDQITSRDEFMAAVTHDLKSPLTFIKGMGQSAPPSGVGYLRDAAAPGSAGPNRSQRRAHGAAARRAGRRKSAAGGAAARAAARSVELHHGRIAVHSEVGRGTTFTVRLPIDARDRESV